MNRRSPLAAQRLRLAGLWVAGALAMAVVAPPSVLAQSGENNWAVPLNLSYSGAATNPAIVLDSDSAMHVLWQDTFVNYVYARYEAGEWSAPQTTDLHLLFGLPSEEGTSQSSAAASDALPFTGPNPLFVAGLRSFIYAFWMTPENKLYVSRVSNDHFTSAAAWTSRKLLSDSAVSFGAGVAANGDLHVAYVQTLDEPDEPAGIYHTRLREFAVNWTAPKLLYGSSYFRGLSGGEANLSLATAGTAETPLVYVAWDNRPRKQVLLAKSGDGGASWEQPVQVDGPVPDSGLAGPYNIRVGATENRAVLVWQSGEPEVDCTQFFRSSGDAGATWSTTQPMLEDIQGCPSSNEFVSGSAPSPDGLIYVLTNTPSQRFLSAWNGTRWSDPQEQLTLSSFEDPETYVQVAYDCHRATWFGERLYVVGCDKGGGGDIWVTSRDVASAPSWFTTPVWSRPALVTSDNLEVSNLELVVTGDDLIHALFSQRHDPAVYYTRWDGTAWSRITPVMQLPEGEATWPAIAAGPRNELFLVARSSNGSLYYSRANSRDAVLESAWSTPTRLPITHEAAVSEADVASDAAGTVYVAYAVPVNDERGVYIIHSSDRGETWSGPHQVFNGAEAGFDVVGSPSLLATVNGALHLIWRQQALSVEDGSQPISLYYAHSEDGGQLFGEAELGVEAPVGWREIVADGAGNLHRLWQPPDVMTTLWDQVSVDGGQSWQTAQRLPSEDGSAAVTVDTVGRVHLVSVGVGSLSHWVWGGSRWQAEAPLRWTLPSQPESPVALLATAANLDGDLVAVWALSTGAGNSTDNSLLYATRKLDLPPRQTGIQATPTQSPPSPTPPSSTPVPEPSFTPAASAESRPTPLPSRVAPESTNGTNPMTQYAMALLPVALLIVVVLGVVAFRLIRVKAQ